MKNIVVLGAGLGELGEPGPLSPDRQGRLRKVSEPIYEKHILRLIGIEKPSGTATPR
jgi:hypothetical protein